MDKPDTQNRTARGLWLLTAICIVASVGYWLLFRQRDQYVDFQGLFPLVLWLALMALHLIGGLTCYLSSRQVPKPAASTLMGTYFLAAALVHSWVAIDYLGADDKLRLAYLNWQYPQDQQLHRLLDQPPYDSAAIAAVLAQGARADSWRNEWALWKVLQATDHDADNRRFEVAQLLLQNGAQPDRKSRSGIHYRNHQWRVDGALERWLLQRDKRNTPLCHTLRQLRPTDAPLLNELLEAGAEVNQICPLRYGQGQSRPTSITGLAIMHRHAEALEQVSARDGQLHTSHDRELWADALRSSAYQGNERLLNALLVHAPGNSDQPAPAPHLADALLGAIQNNQPDSALRLLAAGARPAQADIVLQAMQRSDGHTQLLAALVEAGADINFKRSRQLSPLGEALRRKNLALVKTLLALGADLQRTNLPDGPLHQVFTWPEGEQMVAAELLFKQGADPERRDSSQRTFLQRAVVLNQHELVRVALNYKANTSVTNRRGDTLTKLALTHGDDDMLALLQITAPRPGPDVNKLTWAARYDPLQRVQTLLTEGYPINGLDRTGRTALEAATRRNRRDVYLHLLQAGANVKLSIKDGSRLISANRASSAASVRRLRGLDKNADPAITLLGAAALTG
ncbi:MAG: hypothetical protein AAF993_22130, partial [Pseudomonadota bacterium]